jgi:hypothetical protein
LQPNSARTGKTALALFSLEEFLAKNAASDWSSLHWAKRELDRARPLSISPLSSVLWWDRGKQ